MSKKQEFIKMVEDLLDAVDVNEMPQGAIEYFNVLKNETDKSKTFTENGAKILKYIQQNAETYNNMFKAKEIGAGLDMSSRGASGAMRKLVTDGYLEKVGTEPTIYSLTDKGKEIDVDATVD
jgi:DNA-binding MarR family transcriptional regulator